MRAKRGDWLIVEQGDTERAARRGMIEEVRSPEGAPPYLVRWLDTGHEALVFPGPDAHVLTQDELTLADRHTADRAARVQRDISQRRRS